MALNLLATATASTSSAIDFTSGIDGTYLVYEVHIIGATVSNNSDSLGFRVSTDGGSTWKSGATDYEYASVHNSTMISTGSTYIKASIDIGSAAAHNACSVITVFCPSNTSTRTQVIVSRAEVNISSIPVAEVIGGSYKATTAVDGFRIFPTLGTITSGEFKLYGITAS